MNDGCAASARTIAWSGSVGAEGWNVVHSQVVDTRLTELEAERDAWLNELSDEDFAAYTAVTEQDYAGLRKELATRVG